MNEQEIRKELEILKTVVPESTKNIIDLAERYLACSGEMPKKIDIQATTSIRAEGYNQAIDDCKMAMVKKLEGLEDVICVVLIREYVLVTKEITMAQKLAKAIRKHMEG